MEQDHLHITSWDQHGRGISNYSHQGNSLKIAVPGSIVGEKVTTTPPIKTPSGREASILEIPLPSPFRTKPQCPHFTVCGGCVWQHLEYEEQLRVKQQWIEDIFHNNPLIHPIIPSPMPWQYRNKMEFSFSQDKAGHRFLGLYKSRGRVIDVLSCPISPPWMAETLSCVRAWWEESSLTAYFPKNNSGTLQTITFREGITTGDRMVILTLSGNPAFAPKRAQLNQFVECIRKSATPPKGLLSIIARIKQTAKNRPTQFFEMVLFGPDYFRECLSIPFVQRELETQVAPYSLLEAARGKEDTSVATKTRFFNLAEEQHEVDYFSQPAYKKNRAQLEFQFQISPQAFFQPNTKQAVTIYSQVLQMLKLTPEDTVWDLYCGIGIFGMFSAVLAQSSVGIEISRESAYDATTNSKRLGLSNFSIHCGDVATVISSMKKEGTFKKPTAIIVDPPRVGLSEKALKEIETLSAQKLIYVSCNPHSQSRDVALLLQQGWKIKAIQPVDQFPHTPHIENIIYLEH